ncbi:MAG: hypothetical protein FJ336_00245 [Sphingomonadales bacterium]|nr:hypothetical protein [Sphingomonadales bacterium]
MKNTQRISVGLMLSFGFFAAMKADANAWNFPSCDVRYGENYGGNELLDNDLQKDTERLMEKLASRLAGLRDLQATVHVQADVPRVKVRPLTAEMFFLAPNRFRIRSPRLALLPRQNPMELFEFLKGSKNYRALAMGQEKVRNQVCLVVNVLPLDGGGDWQLIRLWIHPETARVYRAEMTRRNLGTVEAGYFYSLNSRTVPGTNLHQDLPDSLLFELDASMMKLPKTLTADLHRSNSQAGTVAVRPLGAPDGKARVAMGFRWNSVNNGAAARFFGAQKQD